jgi:hypothetical protein
MPEGYPSWPAAPGLRGKLLDGSKEGERAEQVDDLADRRGGDPLGLRYG